VATEVFRDGGERPEEDEGDGILGRLVCDVHQIKMSDEYMRKQQSQRQ